MPPVCEGVHGDRWSRTQHSRRAQRQARDAPSGSGSLSVQPRRSRSLRALRAAHGGSFESLNCEFGQRLPLPASADVRTRLGVLLAGAARSPTPGDDSHPRPTLDLANSRACAMLGARQPASETGQTISAGATVCVASRVHGGEHWHLLGQSCAAVPCLTAVSPRRRGGAGDAASPG